MAKICGIEGCKKIPEFYCECTTKTYHCQRHFCLHVKKVGKTHNSGPLFVLVDRELKEEFIKGINFKYQVLEKAKIEMKKRCSEIIEYTIQSYRNAMKRLKDDQKYFNSIKKMIIEYSEIDKDEHETRFLLSETPVEFSHNLDHIQKEISLHLKYEFQSPDEFKFPEDEECFWLLGTSLYKIDLNTCKKSSQNIRFSFNTYNNSCRLSDNKFFLQDYNTSNCYSIDVKSNAVTQISTMPVSGTMHAMGCIKNIVYIIGGHINVINEAYNTITKQWSKIAPCPVINHHYSGGIVSNKICITNYLDSNAYIYNPITNQYTIQMKLPANHWKPAGYGFILTNSCLYQMQRNNTNNWKTIQYVGGTPSFSICHGISYLFRKGKYLYAINNSYQVWQIDTQLFRAKLLIIT